MSNKQSRRFEVALWPTEFLVLVLLSAWAFLSACDTNLGHEGTTDAYIFAVTEMSVVGTDVVPLDGSTISGVVGIELVPEGRDVGEVTFRVDGVAAAPIAVVAGPPYEIVVDSSELGVGSHTLWASNDRGTLARATFAVRGMQVTPPDPDPPAADPDLPDRERVPDPEPVRADYTVAPWGSDAADGSHERPLRSLAEAAGRVQPGDVIVLRGGTYDGVGGSAYVTIRLSGTAAAPITVRSFPGERAVIDGSEHAWHPRARNDGRSVTSPALLLVFSDHVIWQDITLRYGVGRGFYLQGDHNVVRGVISYGHHSDGIHLRGSYNLLEDVVSYGNDSVANGGDSADGIKIVRRDGALSSFNVIRRAITHSNSDDGIDLWDATDTLVEYSVAYRNGIGPTGNGNGFKLGSGLPADARNVIRYSVAFENRAHNFDANTGGGITLIHNTSWGAGGYGYVLGHRVGLNPPNVAHNNISYGDHAPYIASTGSVHTHNSWNLGIEAPHFDSLDPVSPAFLTLHPSSPAIDRGADLGQPHVGAAPDLGALQHGETMRDILGPLWPSE